MKKIRFFCLFFLCLSVSLIDPKGLFSQEFSSNHTREEKIAFHPGTSSNLVYGITDSNFSHYSAQTASSIEYIRQKKQLESSVLIFQPLTKSGLTVILEEEIQFLLPFDIEICNLMGQKVFSQYIDKQSTSLKMGKNRKGIYIMTIIRDNKKLLVKKFLYD